MGEDIHGVLQGLAAEQRHELLQDGGADDGAAGHKAANFMQQAHDAGHFVRGAADGKFVSADMEVDCRELFFDVPQGLVVTPERLDHLIGVVKENHLRPDTGK
ncbi:hypothetical protein GCM10009712_04700 [Pseudarthrobacter sulfonivorans]